jgi:hypothetical protein
MLGCFFIGGGFIEEAIWNYFEMHMADRIARTIIGTQLILFGCLLLWGFTQTSL